ncbi:MAG: phosphatidate cytidylyltransferase, partial [Anaerolineae bacterium]|nr:phosphatidate cytidylyltransferase [Anaerolineae bacterium]
MRARVISAAILLPAVLVLCYIGGWPYALLVVAATALSANEYVGMFRRRGYTLSVVTVGLLMLLWETSGIWPGQVWFPALVALGILILSLWELI